MLGREIELIIEDDQYAAENGDGQLHQARPGRPGADDRRHGQLGHQHPARAAGRPRTRSPSSACRRRSTPSWSGTHFFNNIAHYGDEADGAWMQIVEEIGAPEDAVVAGISLEVPSGEEWAAYMEQTVASGGGTYVDTVYIAPTATEATAQVTQLQQWIDDEGVNYLSLHGVAGVGARRAAEPGRRRHRDPDRRHPRPRRPTRCGRTVRPTRRRSPSGMHSFLPANNDIEASAEMTRCAEVAGYAGEELVDQLRPRLRQRDDPRGRAARCRRDRAS